MNKYFAVLVIVSGCGPWSLAAAAQTFQDLSTTEDGSALYFSSPIRQKETDQSFHSKIFRWNAAGGIQVVAEVRDAGEFDGCTPPDFYQLRGPQVSLDGSVLAYTAARPTANSPHCSPSEPNQGVVTRPGPTVTLAGNIAIGSNGRYAITTTTAAVANNFHIVTDLTAGASNVVAGAFNGAGRRVTAEATIITPQPSAVILTDRNGRTRILQTKWAVEDAVIDPAGKTVVYVTGLSPGGAGRLTSYDLATDRETEVAIGLAPRNPSLTSDGSTILFIDDPLLTGGSQPVAQLYAIGTGGSNRRQITNEKDGIVSAVISGNGLVAFAVTGNSRLIRVDIGSATVTELVSATPIVTTAYRAYTETTVAAVGSVIRLFGSGLASVRQVTFCGRPVAILPDPGPFVRFQAPWNLPEGSCQAIVQAESSFEHAITFEVKQYDPQFVQGFLVHEGFRGIITSSTPAHPGEEIVAYMTGLGPVDNSGQVTPGFQCSFDSVQAEVLYAGLAPELPGIYQVNVRAPDLHSAFVSLNCGWVAIPRAVTSVWLGP